MPDEPLLTDGRSVVVVTGAGGGLGRGVLRRLATDPDVAHVVAVDRVELTWRDRKVKTRRIDLGRASSATELDEALAGADVLVHLAFDADTEREAARTGRANLATTRHVLASASAAGVRHIVGLSSATAYGAWANNPVPLTEEQPLRPNPDFSYAVQRAEVELLLGDWAAAGEGRTAAVLRPCIALGESGTSWMARALASAAGKRLGQEDPPGQFLHLDDLAEAVDVARRRRLDGPYNVAPDGWIPGDTVRALAGTPPRPRLPAGLAAAVARARWRVRRGPLPPGLLPFTVHRWVVANDRLRAEGWAPTRTNEQAYVAGTQAPWWTMVSPKRRQELALVGMMAGVGAVATAAVLTVRWVRRRRR